MTLPLKYGSKDPQPGGPSVKSLQMKLIAKGFEVGRFGADGIFGDDTAKAVKRYQLRVGLKIDGIVGSRTWAALTKSHVPGTGSAAKMADLALQLVTGQIDGTRPRYVFGAETAVTDPSPDRIDCSELVQWATWRVIGHDWVDGSRNQYAAGQHCSVDEAIHTKGALLFLGDTPLNIHHVAVSMGDATTAEARSSSLGCGTWSANMRGWDYACKIPVLTY